MHINRSECFPLCFQICSRATVHRIESTSPCRQNMARPIPTLSGRYVQSPSLPQASECGCSLPVQLVPDKQLIRQAAYPVTVGRRLDKDMCSTSCPSNWIQTRSTQAKSVTNSALARLEQKTRTRMQFPDCRQEEEERLRILRCGRRRLAPDVLTILYLRAVSTRKAQELDRDQTFNRNHSLCRD